MTRYKMLLSCLIAGAFVAHWSITHAQEAVIFYLEQGILYEGLSVGESEISVRYAVPGEVDRIIDQDEQTVLYLTGEGSGFTNKLWSFNKLHRVAYEISTNVSGASISPRRGTLLVWNNDGRIQLTNLEGVVISTITTQGGWPVLSARGGKVAYVSHMSEGSGLSPGINVFDVITGMRITVINAKRLKGGSLKVLGWFLDGETIYFLVNEKLFLTTLKEDRGESASRAEQSKGIPAGIDLSFGEKMVLSGDASVALVTGDHRLAALQITKDGGILGVQELVVPQGFSFEKTRCVNNKDPLIFSVLGDKKVIRFVVPNRTSALQYFGKTYAEDE